MYHKFLLLTLAGLLSQLIYLDASTTATATVTYTIGSIDAISVSGSPGTLAISTAVAGSNPTCATDSTTTYALTTNNTSSSARKITGALDSDMESGATLTVNLTAPSGATSAGTVSLSGTAANLVTGISNIASSSLGITYTLGATVNAAQVTSPATKTVTYTIGP